MSTDINFPQGPVVDTTTGLVSEEWYRWFLNPQFLSIDLAAAIAVTSGGTGITSGTSGGVLAFTGTTTIASSGLLGANKIVLGGGAGVAPSTPVGLGTTTTLLHGNALGAPTWASVSLTADVSGTLPVGNGGTGVMALGALTKTDDTNVTLTLGGSPSTALVNAASITAGWTGQLAVGRGGTGLSTIAANRVPFASALDTYSTSANLTFDGTTLTTTGFNNTGNTTLGDAAGDTLTISPNAVTWSNNPTHSGNHTFSGSVFHTGTNTLFGTATAQVMGGAVTPQVQVHGTTGTLARQGFGRWTADAGAFNLFGAKSRGATVGTHTVIQNGDAFLTIVGLGSDGTNFQQAASIQLGAAASGTVSSTSMPGSIIFRTVPDTSTTLTTALTLDSAQNAAFTASVKSSSATGGVGYATGAGGTVTQGAGSGKATAVTLNTATGEITMNNAALNAATIVTFVFNNSAVAAADLIATSHHSAGTTGAYTINARATGAGTAAIDVRNNTAGNLSEAIVIKYAVIKAVTS